MSVTEYIKKYKYETLLLSLLMLIFGDFLVPNQIARFTQPILLLQNIAIGWALFNLKRLKWLVGFLFVSILIAELFQFSTDSELRVFIGIAYIVFFIFLSLRIYRKIYRSKKVEKEMISAVFCGFIMLAMIGSFIFMVIEILHPHSFSNIGTGVEKFENIQYFSFITTLTIGYGDIVPVSSAAKQFTILLSLTGNFYSVFVVGIVIGKFLQSAP